MAQSSIFHAPGLERDFRQDEFPTRQDEFPTRQDEFPTRQDEFPTAYHPNCQTLKHEDPQVLSEPNSNLPLHKPVTKPRGCLCGLRKSTFWLGAILLVLLLVIAIGAGVLGSRLRISEQKSNGSPSLFSTALPSSTITSPTTSSSTPIPAVKQLLQPDNDCGAIGPQYTVRIRTISDKTVNTQFNVSCNAEFGGGDFMSFYSPSLTTCMHGCAMFNHWQTVYKNHLELNCSGVTYFPGTFGEGNCWLKRWGYTTAVTEKNTLSYARLNPSS